MKSIGEFIEKRLRLKVNSTKSAVAQPSERHFLGFTLKYDATDGLAVITLSRRSRSRLASRITELTPRNFGNSISECVNEVNQYFTGWMGFFRICSGNVKSLLRSHDAHTRRRLRAIHLKHWKRRRFIYRQLIKLGVKREMARMVFARKRKLWALSHCMAVDRGLNNKYFTGIGLLSLSDLWDKWNPVNVVIASGQQLLPFE